MQSLGICTLAAYFGMGCRKQVAPEVEQRFVQHLLQYGQSYGTPEEYQFRLGLFQDTDEKLQAINADPTNAFTVGHNKFSAMTEDEKQRHFGFRGMNARLEAREPKILDETDIPTSVDWREKGAVTNVKDQG